MTWSRASSAASRSSTSCCSRRPAARRIGRDHRNLCPRMRAAVITISTSLSQGQGVDESGPALVEFARTLDAEVVATEVVPDERSKIEWALRHYADSESCDLVLTTGGTGFSPDDVTPEATRAVMDRDAPGIAEAMRAASRPHTPNWMLSRAV